VLDICHIKIFLCLIFFMPVEVRTPYKVQCIRNLCPYYPYQKKRSLEIVIFMSYVSTL